ncbi:unnamed protein product [Urochloa decumbens]|uniref:Uncharacterized protein n=1 Tax=Urochloa decumbens TaxID=240449 RepID=A0ABC9G5U7_9POAL
MLMPVSHLPAVPAASRTRVVVSLRRPQPFHFPTQSPLLSSSIHRPPLCPRRRRTRSRLPRMDPDQAAAAAGGFQHDDIGDTTTYADGGGSGAESWGRALLWRGWDLSRKAAIAGVAAAAAPVVAPQLIILSVAGLALSLPFAAYLASFAATERLMGTLLPPPRAQPYHAWDDLDDDELFLDASEAPGGGATAFGYWSEAEDGGIVEEDEMYPSLPLSREPRLAEELVPPLSDEEGTVSEGEFCFQELGHAPFVLDNRAGKEEGSDYITMEAQLRQSIDDSRSAAPELSEEDDMVPRIEEALVAAEEPVQELSASDNGDETEDGKRTATEETESSKEMMSSGTDIGTTEASGFPVQILGKDDTVVQREGEREVLVRESGQESQVSDAGEKTEGMLSLVSEKTEEIPLQEVNIPESSVPVEMEGDVTMEMVLEEVTIDTDPVTEEVVGVQIEAIATELPECEPLHLSDLVAQESQEMAEGAHVDDVLESTLTEDVVMDIGDVSTEGVKHNAVGDVTSVVSSAVTVDDVVDTPSSTSTPNVSTINQASRPDVDHSNQTSGVKLSNEGFSKKELVEDKSAKTEESKSMDDIDVSKSQVPDDESKREDEVTMEMVLEEVTSATDLVTGEVVGVQVDIIASGSEPLPPSDFVAQELQVVTEPETVDSIQGSTVRGGIVIDVDDTNTEGVEHHNEGGDSSFISGASVVTVDEAEDLMSSRIKPYVSAISKDTTSVEGRPDVEHPHETTGFEYKLMNEGLKREIVAEDKEDNYTEEQLREQLDTLRTITGYRPAASSTLEAELSGLYIFVGVEPPVDSRDASDLTEINMKLRFLKSIIGVE